MTLDQWLSYYYSIMTARVYDATIQWIIAGVFLGIHSAMLSFVASQLVGGKPVHPILFLYGGVLALLWLFVAMRMRMWLDYRDRILGEIEVVIRVPIPMFSGERYASIRRRCISTFQGLVLIIGAIFGAWVYLQLRTFIW